jgi:hypothetical protein
MTRTKTLLAVVAAIALLAFAAPAAFAQSGSEGYYGSNVVAGLDQGGSGGNSGGNAGGQVAAAQTTPVQATTDTGGSLPFTGADLGVLAAAGMILLSLGYGLRRLTHRPSH